MKNLITKLFWFLLLMLFTVHSTTAQDAKTYISNFLSEKASDPQLAPTDIADWEVTDETLSKKSGIKHLYFQQRYNGIPIDQSLSSLHITTNGDLLKSNMAFVNQLSQKANRLSPSITKVSAIESAAKHLGLELKEALQLIKDTNAKNAKSTFSRGGIASQDISIQLIYHQGEKGNLQLAWEVHIFTESQDEYWVLLVDTGTGEILKKHNLVLNCNWGGAHEHEHDHENENDAAHDCSSDHSAIASASEEPSNMMLNSYNVFPEPIESPYYGSRSVITDPADPIASPYKWHDTNGANGAEYTITRGNNVHAYENGDNIGYSPNGGIGLVFDYPVNLTYTTSNQSEDAAITNLFYWNNLIHDVVYHYGFDEISGNFQQNNYGNGGAAGDYVQARAQISNVCNAFFFTPADGSIPNMKMYICNQHDGCFDNLVVVHEYAHGISNRLTGGPASVNCLSNSEQMGEGWSDWYGLMMTIQPGDVGSGSRTVGNFLFNQGAGGAGIRPFPYSTNMLINPHTYDDIKTSTIPHGVGSIWAAMLWEMTWALIDQHGYDPDLSYGTGGNNMALNLVTLALKLQPCSPGFVDGRDAILAADNILYGGVNQCLIWDAFAKRGLGLSASQGSSGSVFDGTEAFNVQTCDSDGDGFPDNVDCAPNDPTAWELDICGICGGDGSTCTDADGDGVFADVDPDDNDPCVPDNTHPNCDTDGDGTPDGLDCAPNDPSASTLDICGVCGGNGSTCTDADGDGVFADVDPDDNNPCVPDASNGNCCPFEHILSGNFSSGTYQATTSITATGMVSNGSNVLFDAGTYVLLQSTFEANSNAVFEAKIGGCASPVAPALVTNDTQVASGSEATQVERNDPDAASTALLKDVSIRNYPNPFSAQTTFEIELPAASFVSIDVYNVDGKLMGRVLEKQALPSGKYVVEFDAGELANGIYYYRMISDFGVKGGSMILQR